VFLSRTDDVLFCFAEWLMHLIGWMARVYAGFACDVQTMFGEDEGFYSEIIKKRTVMGENEENHGWNRKDKAAGFFDERQRSCGD
jgi:hypothetical protein